MKNNFFKKALSVFTAVAMSVSLFTLLFERLTVMAGAETADLRTATTNSNTNINYFAISDFGRMSIPALGTCVDAVNSYSTTDELWMTARQLILDDGLKMGVLEILSKLGICSGFDEKQIDAVTDSIVNNYVSYYCSGLGNELSYSSKKLQDTLDMLGTAVETVDDWETLTQADIAAIYSACGLYDDYAEELLDAFFGCDDIILKSAEHGVELTQTVYNCMNMVLINNMIVEDLIESVDEDSLLHYGLERRFTRITSDINDTVTDVVVSEVLDLVIEMALSGKAVLAYDAVKTSLELITKFNNKPTAENLIRVQYALDMAMTLRDAVAQAENTDAFEMLFKAYAVALSTTYSYCEDLIDEDTELGYVYDVYDDWLDYHSYSSYDKYMTQKAEYIAGNKRPSTNVSIDIRDESIVIYPDGFKVGDYKKITFFGNFVIWSNCNDVTFSAKSDDKTIWQAISATGTPSTPADLNIYYEDGIVIRESVSLKNRYINICGDNTTPHSDSIYFNNDFTFAGVLTVMPDAIVNISGHVDGKNYGYVWAAESSIINRGHVEVGTLDGFFDVIQNEDGTYFLVNGNVNGNVDITAGTFEIKGDINSHFEALDNSKVIFSGDKIQNITTITGVVTNAEITNKAGISFTCLSVYGDFKGNNNPISGTMYLYENAHPDENTYCDFYIDYNEYSEVVFEFKKDTILNGNVTGHRMIIPENINLIVNGNCTNYINNYGTVTINGNIEDRTISNYGNMTIRGNALNQDITNYGTLNFCGNANSDNITNTGCIYISGNMTTPNISGGKWVLCGHTAQKFTPYSSYYNSIKHLEITNTSADGITIENVNVQTLFQHNRNTFTVNNKSKFVDYDGDGLKDNVDPYPTIKSANGPDKPEGLELVYGNTLDSVSLPANWSWLDDTTILEAGTHNCIAIYTVDDYDMFDYTDVDGYDPATHTISAELQVTVMQKDIEPTVEFVEQCVYDGNAKEPALTLSYNNIVLDNSDYSCIYHNNINAGIDSAYVIIKPTDNGNYNFAEIVKYFTINKASPVLIEPTSTPITYGDTLSSSVLSDSKWVWVDELTIPNATQNYNAYIEVDDINYDYTGVEGYDPDNHRVVRGIMVQINRAALTITARNYTLKVGSSFPTYDYMVTGLVGNDTLPFDISISCAAADSNVAGTYPIIVSGVSNGILADLYTIKYINGTLTVTEKDAQTVTASDVTLTYGDTNGKITATTDGDGAIFYELTTGADVISVAADGTITVLKAGAATVTVNASETDDYAAATKTITVTVNKKKIAIPAADTNEYIYTGQPQTYGVTSTADYTVIGGLQTNAGEYPITIALNNENYEWDGALSTYEFVIKRVPVTVTAKSYTIKFGASLPAFEYDVTDLVNNETLPIDVTIFCTADSKTPGSYDIVVSGAATSTNYTFSYVNGTLTVSEKEVVAAPIFTPASGTTFTSTQGVTIACATEGAKIYYTTDGTIPTTASDLYEGAITINKTTTIKAIAVKDNMTDSSVITAIYTKKSTSTSSGGSYGGSSGGSGGGIGRPSATTNPEINGKSASWTTIATDISKLPIGSKTTIEMNGNYDIPVDVIKAIADKDTKVTFIVDSTRSWIINGAEINAPTSANLSIITITSLNTDSLRGEASYKFRLNSTNTLTELKLTFAKKNVGKFANLYKKDGDKLIFVDSTKIDADGNAMRSVSEKGDYVVMVCECSDRKGDVSNDGITNALDASAILKDIVELEDAANPEMLDYNGDGKVNALDASALLIDIVNGNIA